MKEGASLKVFFKYKLGQKDWDFVCDTVKTAVFFNRPWITEPFYGACPVCGKYGICRVYNSKKSDISFLECFG